MSNPWPTGRIWPWTASYATSQDHKIVTLRDLYTLTVLYISYVSQDNFSSFTVAKRLYTQDLYTTGKFKVMLYVLFSTMDSRDGRCYQTSIVAFSTISQSWVWEDYTFSLTAAFLFPNVVIFFMLLSVLKKLLSILKIIHI